MKEKFTDIFERESLKFFSIKFFSEIFLKFLLLNYRVLNKRRSLTLNIIADYEISTSNLQHIHSEVASIF